MNTAEALIKQGLRLTPLIPGEKRPKTHDWQNGNGAIDDPSQLRDERYGVLIENGNLGIDIDVKNVNGIANFAAITKAAGSLPRTLRTITRSGGRHLYFKLPKGSSFSGPIKRDDLGIEVYTNGRQFVAVDAEYRVIPDQIAEAPDELLIALESLRISSTQKTRSYGRIHEGTRNNSLFRRVCQWVGMGIEPSMIMDLAYRENEKCDPPLSEHEVRQLVDGALKRYPLGRLLLDWDLAVSVADRFSGEVLYCVEPKAFYVKGQFRWERDETGGRIAEIIQEFRREMLTEAALAPDSAKAFRKRIEQLGNIPTRKRLIEDLSRQRNIERRATEQDALLHIVGVQNGWLDFENDELVFHPDCPDEFVTKAISAAFDPKADCPNFLRALEVWFPDRALREFIQRLAGYILVEGNKDEIFIFLQGPEAAGKSKFSAILLHLMGDYGVAMNVATITERNRRGGGPSEDLARLAGIRLAVTDEPEEGARFGVSLVKSLTGRDRMNARRLHENSFDFDPNFLLMIHSNHDLYAPSDDGGFWRRIKKVPFVNSIPNADRDADLLDKLKAEGSGILNWAVEGLNEYRSIGLDPPEVIRVASREYRDSNDLIGDFLKDACVLGDACRVKPKILYASFKDWSHENGIRCPMQRRIFDRKLKDRGFVVEADSSKARWWAGIGLQAGREESSDVL